MSSPLYFKITNLKENHHGFQYKEGLNVLEEKFNNDPTASCVSGGFYFTTKEHIHEFYMFGIYLRIVELPTNDPEFKMVMDAGGDKWRANKIIFKERYSLGDQEIYKKFGIEFPDITFCIDNGFIDLTKHIISGESGEQFMITSYIFSTASEPFCEELTKYLVDNNKININYALIKAVKREYVNLVKYLIDKGADIHVDEETPLINAVTNNDLEVVECLVNNGADVCAKNNLPIKIAAKNSNEAMVKYFVENGADINVLDEIKGYNINDFEIVKYLVGKGANPNNNYLYDRCIVCGNVRIFQFLLEKGINVHYKSSEYLKYCTDRISWDLTEVNGKPFVKHFIMSSFYEIIKLYIEKGADIHFDDEYLLRTAVDKGLLNLVELLVENDADVHVLDDYCFKKSSENTDDGINDYLVLSTMTWS